MYRKLYLIITIVSTTTLFASLTKNKEANINHGILHFVRTCVLAANPAEEFPNPCAWRDGLDTKTLVTLRRVSKDFYGACEIIVDEPCKKVIQRLPPEYTIRQILFNKYGQWLAVMQRRQRSDAQHPYDIFLGYDSNIVHLTDSNLCDNNFHIRTMSVDYVDKNNMKQRSSLFYLLNYHHITVILPDQNELHTILFRYPQHSQHEQKNAPITQSQKSLSAVIGQLFKLSEKKDFWNNYKYIDSAIEIDRTNTKANIIVNLADPLFADALQNYNRLFTNTCFSDEKCSCSTNYVAPACQKNYSEVCGILNEEELLKHKNQFCNQFVALHILQDLKHIFGDDEIGNRVFINPFGKLVLKKGYNNSVSAPYPPYFEQFHIQALEESKKWYNKNGFIFSTISITGEYEENYEKKEILIHRSRKLFKESLQKQIDTINNGNLTFYKDEYSPKKAPISSLALAPQFGEHGENYPNSQVYFKPTLLLDRLWYNQCAYIITQKKVRTRDSVTDSMFIMPFLAGGIISGIIGPMIGSACTMGALCTTNWPLFFKSLLGTALCINNYININSVPETSAQLILPSRIAAPTLFGLFSTIAFSSPLARILFTSIPAFYFGIYMYIGSKPKHIIATTIPPSRYCIIPFLHSCIALGG